MERVNLSAIFLTANFLTEKWENSPSVFSPDNCPRTSDDSPTSAWS